MLRLSARPADRRTFPSAMGHGFAYTEGHACHKVWPSVYKPWPMADVLPLAKASLLRDYSLALATDASFVKAPASLTASSANILRLTSTPACFNPNIILL